MTRHSTDPGLTEHERDVLQRLEATGWFVNKIAEDSEGPGFAYSFGLYERYQHPEIIIFGLPPDIMHRLINDIGKRVSGGMRYGDGDQSHDLLEDYSCVFRRVNPLRYRETLTWTMWFYESSDFPALQLFWPDKAHRFPWDPGCSEIFRKSQPDMSRSSTSA
ncbi:DUF4262 domain-containing protein [Edaphobacter bradus]|uniref:DUF4262 domain-containing protein n=1 Tax=Edaphobacter bradus TaxID=2259016 RepID=UPI0037C00CFD